MATETYDLPKDDVIQTGRSRLLKVFRYLEALNQQRNPVKRQIDEQFWTLWFHNLPEHHCIRVGVVETTGRTSADGTPENTGDDFVLKVRRPQLTKVPPPPAHIREWLRPGWDDVNKDVNKEAFVIEADEKVTADGEEAITRFDDDPDRVVEFNNWLKLREEWGRKEKPARETLKIFDRVYELYGQIEREAERLELVLGDGLLVWRRPEGGIHHPVLLQRLQLEFNPEIPEFTFRETQHPVEFYSALFRAMSDVDGRMIGKLCEELEQGAFHPLDENSTSGFLRSFVQRLAKDGEFVSRTEIHGEADYPRITRDPVIFVRSRTLGFATALEAAIEELTHTKELPVSLLNIVGVESLPPLNSTEVSESLDGRGNEDEDILFNKPANQEQLQIAQRLDKHRCVLVQGPPGTGKTHTIANLIGHLLAQGQSVLVTSHTSKALRVVRSQVAPELQSLCVSVLESDAESRQQLESSINGIVQQLSSNVAQLEHQAQELKARRTQIIRDLRETRAKMRDALGSEYRDIVVGGQSTPPSEAARQVAAGHGKHDWIPVPLSDTALGTSLPLGISELKELYQTNLSVSPEDERELGFALPVTDDLLKPEDFAALVTESAQLASRNLKFREDLWKQDTTASPQELEILLRLLQRAAEPLQHPDQSRWKIAVIADGQRGGSFRQAWEDLLVKITEVEDKAEQAVLPLLQHGPEISVTIPLENQLQILREIIGHLSNGGDLGWWTLFRRSEWKQLIEGARVGGHSPSRIEHFQALQSLTSLQLARTELLSRWDRQMKPLGVPPASELGERPEQTCQQYCFTIRQCLNWQTETWRPLEKEMIGCGFNWEKLIQELPPNFNPHGLLLRIGEAVSNHLPAIFAARIDCLRWEEVEAQLRDYEIRVFTGASREPAARIVSEFRAAVSRRDIETYQKTYTRIVELHERSGAMKRRRELLRQLEKTAPAWADAIRRRIVPHNLSEPPGDASQAWLWRQFNDELETRARVSIDSLQKQIESLTTELQRTTSLLIEASAWAAQIRKTNLEQQQALEGWRLAMRKIGKGTGKRVPALLAEARRKMELCRSAVPVWIMPLARVVENFKPRTGLFDVVIIDEASQSDVMGLIALLMGKRVVIVGDDEQVSPDAVGQQLKIIQNLIATYLHRIPNAQLYDGETSIYDIAKTSFSGLICLREHFRCVPEIIQFSSDLSYPDKKIEPLRDASSVRLKPPVIAHRISGGTYDEKTNEAEAETITSLIIAAIEQPDYDQQTFGVISLVGNEQAEIIDRLLRSRLSATEYMQRAILCGNAAQFQGDERDVMFLSVVYASQDGPLAKLNEKIFKKRFNVAASRARNQMWVVHSLQPEVDLKPGDLRRRLIEYAQNPQAINQALTQQANKVDSEFELRVLRRLVTAGYRVTSQWKVGSYRIDLVVSGDGGRLAVECDGDRWHQIEKIPEDMARQAILERLGWKFVRIRGSEFFRNPEQAMQPVFARLEALGIEPQGIQPGTETESSNGNELRTRVIRRAEEIRREWKSSDSKSSDSSGVSALQSTVTSPDENILDLPEDIYRGKSSPSLPLFLDLEMAD